MDLQRISKNTAIRVLAEPGVSKDMIERAGVGRGAHYVLL